MKTTVLACDGPHDSITPAVESVTIRFSFSGGANTKTDVCEDCLADLLNALAPFSDQPLVRSNGHKNGTKKNGDRLTDKIISLLASDTGKAWAVADIKKAIPGHHGNTYAATLSQLHRQGNRNVKRVGAGLYAYDG